MNEKQKLIEKRDRMVGHTSRGTWQIRLEPNDVIEVTWGGSDVLTIEPHAHELVIKSREEE